MKYAMIIQELEDSRFAVTFPDCDEWDFECDTVPEIPEHARRISRLWQQRTRLPLPEPTPVEEIQNSGAAAGMYVGLLSLQGDTGC